MHKKYIVRLSDAERETSSRLVKQRRVSFQKVRRAQVLLKADVDGPSRTDVQVAEAFDSCTRTVEFIRERLVTKGLRVLRSRSTVNPKGGSAVMFSMGSKKPRSVRYGWAGRPKDSLTGRCDCLPNKPWHWKSWKQSATRPCVGH